MRTAKAPAVPPSPRLPAASKSSASTSPDTPAKKMPQAKTEREKFVSRTLTTVFTALLIDILAFTVILPLFPRILRYYEAKDGSDPGSTYYVMMGWVRRFRVWIGGSGSHLDVVLFGGAVGWIFSFLQFVSSPIIGSLSDKYGRRTILLISMIGNGVSMILWSVSKSFEVFVLSRIVGGLTEGNVQMSMAMISDVTTPETRSKGMALVGVAFSLGFTLGPSLGAWFATKVDMQRWVPAWLPVNEYSGPALFALALIVVESVYMFVSLPETIDFKTRVFSDEVVGEKKKVQKKKSKQDVKGSNSTSRGNGAKPSQLTNLSVVHFVYLLLFSGMEFTLTFLTHDRFDFSHARQGMMLGYMGLLSALVQGGYVRRMAGRVVSEKTMAMQGMLACGAGFVVMGMSGGREWMLWIGATLQAFTSGTVVSCLTSLASMTGGEEVDGAGERGKVLGTFRAVGQLGRAMGPLVGCSLYWIVGSTVAYVGEGLAMVVVVAFVSVVVEQRREKSKSD
ncbi:major facilitator superfamily domain-containing protein [Cladochytrium replicatum]|nr:major facilitator superfamily domain-containing protein [Cladochytrium replicatum]